MRKVKIVLVGAGSSSFGRGTIADLMASKELRDLDLLVVLVDTDKVALERMYRFSQLIKDYYKARIEIRATTDRREALPGADYVIAAVARKRRELWNQDFCVPFTFGFKQVYGENGGPGAAFHTLRSLHLMIPICRDMEKLCSDALLINFTNPESRVCLGTSKLTRIRVVGLCHGVFDTLEAVARILGKSKQDIEITIGGINHFHWLLRVHDNGNKQDLYPELHRRMNNEKLNQWLDSLTRYAYEVFGLFPFPSPSHLGEYLSFAYDVYGPAYHVERILSREEKRTANSVSQKISKAIDGRESLAKELTQPTQELAIPIICDIEFNRDRRELSVNVPNENLAVSNLPKDAIVEVPARVNAEGIHPVKVGSLPEVIAAMCRTQISVQKLLVEAYRERSKRILLQALLVDPMVDSVNGAKKMIEELLRIERDFLPVLH